MLMQRSAINLCLLRSPAVIELPASGDVFAEWDFAQDSGTELTDISGNDNHGTLGVGATWIGGATKGLNLDGRDVALPRNTNLETTVGDFTVIWVISNNDLTVSEYYWGYGQAGAQFGLGKVATSNYEVHNWATAAQGATLQGVDVLHTIAMVHDASESPSCTFYLNRRAESFTGALTLAATWGSHVLGQVPSCCNANFKGYYGVLWDTILSETQFDQGYDYLKQKLAARSLTLP